jgi:2-dehydro-3-deoxygluconokinase
MLDILALGEPLMEFAEVQGDGAGSQLYLKGFGGDISNMAVAAARQNATVGIFTALGEDQFASDFLQLWDREGIDRSTVILRSGERTGIYFIGYGTEGHVFSYFRNGSAASLVTPAELPLDAIAGARVLYISAISQAISQNCTDACVAAIRHARSHGNRVCYDTNLRLKLWPLDRARTVIHSAVALADIVRPSLDDARMLTGLQAPDEICRFYLALGPAIVALTLGKDGAMIATADGCRLVPSSISVDAVDATGAGDTFSGAFVAEWLRSRDPYQAAAYGNVAAALSTLGKGAVAPIPRRDIVQTRLAQTRSNHRNET